MIEESESFHELPSDPFIEASSLLVFAEAENDVEEPEQSAFVKSHIVAEVLVGA